MYFRNSTHSGGAFFEQANPSPPPSCTVGSPPLPSAGTGNQPRSAPMPRPSVLRPLIVPSSQSPMSSMAAVRLLIRAPDGLVPEPNFEPRKSGWNGDVPTNALRSSPAFTKHGSSNFLSLDAEASVAGEQSWMANWYHQCAAGQPSPA